MGEAAAKSDFINQAPKLKSAHFKFFQQLIFDVAGIRMQDSKMSLVTTRLARRLRVNQLDSWDQYIELLKSGNKEELKEFTNVLTTNKTEFYREKKHFDFLFQTFLPDLVAKKKFDPLFWVAACSYGQEVYTLKMVIQEFNRQNGVDIRPKILATDIDTDAIRIAEKGEYEKALVERDVDTFTVKRYFLKGTGPNANKYLFNPEFRDGIKYRYHNLCDFDDNVPISFDGILLRNVLIYFSPETVEKVITKMLRHLNTGGTFIVGHCESILDMKWKLSSPQQSVYIKEG